MTLSESEAEEVSEMLNTMDEATVNLIALDRKYKKQWYAEQLCHLRQMDQYFADVGRVMEMAGRNDAQRAIDKKRDHLAKVMAVYQDAMRDLGDGDEPYAPTTNNI